MTVTYIRFFFLSKEGRMHHCCSLLSLTNREHQSYVRLLMSNKLNNSDKKVGNLTIGKCSQLVSLDLKLYSVGGRTNVKTPKSSENA